VDHLAIDRTAAVRGIGFGAAGRAGRDPTTRLMRNQPTTNFNSPATPPVRPLKPNIGPLGDSAIPRIRNSEENKIGPARKSNNLAIVVSKNNVNAMLTTVSIRIYLEWCWPW
jgi:hypothetical protein